MGFPPIYQKGKGDRAAGHCWHSQGDTKFHIPSWCQGASSYHRGPMNLPWEGATQAWSHVVAPELCGGPGVT